jgi:nicotinamide riboside kinase
MRIALIGNSGTGKTTLAERLAARTGFPLVEEFARDLLREWNIVDYAATPRERWIEFQKTLLSRKLEREAKLDAFVADRATIDTAATWLIRLAGQVPDQLSTAFIERCHLGMDRYDHLFLLPSNILPLEVDGVRETDWSRRLLFDLTLIGFLQEWRCSYHVLDTISLEDRVAEVLDHLRLAIAIEERAI